MFNLVESNIDVILFLVVIGLLFYAVIYDEEEEE